jgi:hypothetical protein
MTSAGGPTDWVMEVYNGTCGSLILLECDDDDGIGLFPKINLYKQTPGNTILIRVWEYQNNATGDFNICSYIIPPENALCTSATSITCGSLIQNESTELAIDNGDVTGCDLGTGLWYNFSPSFSGTTTITITPDVNYDPEISVSTSSDCTTFTNIGCEDEAGNGGVETYTLSFTAGENYYIFIGDRLGMGTTIGTFDISLTGAQPSNDACGNATVLSLGGITVCTPLLQNNYCATSSIATPIPTCASFQDGRDIWYSVPAPTSGNLTVEVNSIASVSWAVQTYTGTCGGLNLLNCSNGLNIIQELTNLIPGETVLIRLWSENNTIDGEFDICAYETPAVNYLCTLATSLSCGSTLIFETTAGSLDNGNVTGCDLGVGVWYKFIPTNSSSAQLTITTEPSFDVEVSVASSSDCITFTNITCQDNAGPGGTEDFFFPYVLGTTYYIYVGDRFDTGMNTGSFDISLNCINDFCGQAEVLQVGIPAECNNIVRSNVNATDSGELPAGSCGAFGIGIDNWFAAVVPASGFLTIEMSDAGGPSNWAMEAYSGTCGSLTSIECNDDFEGSLFPTLNLENQVPGATLLIRVWEYDNDEVGNFNICAFETPQDNYLCTTATSLVCGQQLIAETNERSLNTDNNTLGCSLGIGVGVWYKYEPVQDGNLILEVDPDATLAVEVAVVTSTDCINFTNVACSSGNLPVGGLATVSFSAVVGNTYYFYVGDQLNVGTNTGLFDISLSNDSPPINDDCTNAYLLPVNVNNTCFGIIADNYCASPSGELPLPSCGNFGGGQDLWYAITVPASGNTVVRIEEAGGPSTWHMEAYSGACGGLASVVCSSSSNNGTTLLNIMGSTPGESLLIRVWEDGSDESGLFSICATEFVAPTNDDCASATELFCGSILENETLDLASNADSGPIMCAGGGAVWYKFEPSNSGTTTVEVTGYGYSPDLSVTTSTDCITFNVIDCQNSGSSIVSSTFPYVAGTIYYIHVANPDFNFGNFDISLTGASPSNDLCINATALPVGLAGQCTNVTYDNYCANTTDIPTCFSNTISVWFSVIVPPSGNINVELSGGNLDNNWAVDAFTGACSSLALLSCYGPNGGYPFINLDNRPPGEEIFLKIIRFFNTDQGTFDICAYEPIPDNDICTDAKPIGACQSFTNETTYNSTENGDDTGCDMGNGIWYKYDAISSGSTTVTVTPSGGFDPEISLSTTSDCITFTNINCSNTTGVETITFTATQATSYYIYVGDNCCNTTGSFDIEVSVVSPSNDECSNPTPLTIGSTCINTSGSTYCATQSSELPLPNCAAYNSGANDIWFSIIVPPNGSLIIETSQLNNPDDTALAVYSGTCGSLELLACDDDGGLGTFSKITLENRIAGEVLLIRVWAWRNYKSIAFNICVTSEVVNDDCLTATQITCGLPLINESTFGSTDNGDGTGCDIGVGTWYVFAATTTGVSTIEVSPEASFDPEISISTTSDCSTFTNIACADNAGNGGLESYALSHTSGTNYYIYVGDRIGIGTTTGSFDISIICESDLCDDAIPIPIGESGICSSIIGSNSMSTASGTLPTPLCGQFGTGLDNWHSVTIPTSQNLTIELNDGGSGLDWSMEAYTGPDCNNLVLYACAENSGAGSPEFINLESLAEGSTVFIRVWKNQSNMLIELGDYNICAYQELAVNTSCTLATSISCNSTISNLTNIGMPYEYISPSCYDGNRVWFKYEPTTNGTATLTVNPLNTQAAFVDVLTSSDCLTFESITCNATSGGNDNIISFVYSTNVTYYFLVGNGSSNLNFDISIDCSSCISPDFFAYNDYSDCPNTSVINFEIADLGSYSGADISNDVNMDVLTNVGIGTYQFTGFTQGIDVKFYITDNTDPTCIDSTTVSIAANCPPINDELYSAITVQCGSLLLNETLSNATNTVPDPINQCYPGEAIWYKFESLGLGDVTILITPDASLHPSIDVYKLDNGNINLDYCATSSLGNQLALTFSFSENSIYYFKVGRENSTGPSQYFNLELNCETLPPPNNDECLMATEVFPVAEGNCSYPYFQGGGATASSATSSCDGFDDDVWIKFTATNESHKVTLYPTQQDLVYSIYNGSCGSLTEGYCEETQLINDFNQTSFKGLVVGETYYIRVASADDILVFYDFYICIETPVCENDYNLSGTIDTDQYYSTDGTITSSQIIEGTANIDYDSGSEIDLLSGFEVKHGAVFNAIIGGCNYGNDAIELNFD